MQKVGDRQEFKTTDADRVLLSPEGLQARVDALVGQAGAQARCFVRPSGTEDCVRVYCEAETSQACNELAERVCGVVFDEYGGVGQRPTKFVS